MPPPPPPGDQPPPPRCPATRSTPHIRTGRGSSRSAAGGLRLRPAGRARRTRAWPSPGSCCRSWGDPVLLVLVPPDPRLPRCGLQRDRAEGHQGRASGRAAAWRSPAWSWDLVVSLFAIGMTRVRLHQRQLRHRRAVVRVHRLLSVRSESTARSLGRQPHRRGDEHRPLASRSSIQTVPLRQSGGRLDRTPTSLQRGDRLGDHVAVAAQHRAVGHLAEQCERLLERPGLGQPVVGDDVEIGAAASGSKRLPAAQVRAGVQRGRRRASPVARRSLRPASSPASTADERGRRPPIRVGCRPWRGGRGRCSRFVASRSCDVRSAGGPCTGRRRR